MMNRLSRPIPGGHGLWNLGSQAHLMEQDYRNYVVPHLNGGEAYRLRVNGTTRQSVQTALSIDRGARGGPGGFIRVVASLLLNNKEVWLEVASSAEEESTRQFQVFIVNGVREEPSVRVTQELPPRGELPDWYPEDEAWGQTVELDPDRMIHIPMPEAYPKDLIGSVMSELAEISTFPTPDWARRQMIGQYPGAPRFDHAEAYRIERLRILEAALPIGWTAREAFLSQSSRVMSYYYYLLRELRFLHFVASMRERAEVGLVQVLQIAGERCGFSVNVTTHGVITPAEVCGIIGAFESGSLSFAAVREIKYQTGVYPPKDLGRDL